MNFIEEDFKDTSKIIWECLIKVDFKYLEEMELGFGELYEIDEVSTTCWDVIISFSRSCQDLSFKFSFEFYDKFFNKEIVIDHSAIIIESKDVEKIIQTEDRGDLVEYLLDNRELVRYLAQRRLEAIEKS